MRERSGMWVCDYDECKHYGALWSDEECPTGRCPTCGSQIATFDEWLRYAALSDPIPELPVHTARGSSGE